GIERLGDGPGGVGGDRYVRRDTSDVGVIAGSLPEWRRAPPGDENLGAVFRKAARRGPADAGGPTRDDHNLVLQAGHDCLLIPCRRRRGLSRWCRPRIRPAAWRAPWR